MNDQTRMGVREETGLAFPGWIQYQTCPFVSLGGQLIRLDRWGFRFRIGGHTAAGRWQAPCVSPAC